MVEIALCLAIIGFAIVAIMGVLPSGMTVQRDNRWNSIVNEDGQFWLNAIREGARVVPELEQRVQRIWINTNEVSSADRQNSEQIIGLLSQPGTTNKALVRALSGSAAELSSAAEVGLDYVLFTMIQPFEGGGPNLASNLYDVRLVFRWPAYPNGSFGRSKKVFRSLVRGQLVETNNLFFFDNQQLKLTLPPSP